MLKQLTVENYALIERLDMELSPALNIITGQTGAGKSILLGALGLSLGNRADISALKDNDHNCVVEAVFDLESLGLEEFFEANDLEYQSVTTIRRVITPAGKSRAYINDLPVQLSVLKELSSMVIDIHSQHQSLLVGDERFRTGIVDAMAGDSVLLTDYRAIFVQLKQAEKELEQAKEQLASAQREQDWVRYQYNELAQLKLSSGELEELESEQKELSNAVEIAQTIGSTINDLDTEETGILSLLKQIEHSLLKIKDFYRPAAEFAQRVASTSVELRDINDTLTDEIARVESNPERLDQIDGRIGSIYALFQKHRVKSIDELLDLQRGFAAQLELIDNSDKMVGELEQRIADLGQRARDKSAEITKRRTKAAGELGKGVETMLSRLGMKGSRFVCAVSPTQLSMSGADEISFMFSSSVGATMQPLEKIASGGEISRVMLCLKAIAARRTMLSTIIFDEIDTGVSGAVADATGQIIEELSKNIQVVNITHLPQVASKGDTHFVVYKESTGRTQIKRLSREERVDEIAAMLSGQTVSDAARSHAEELLGRQ